MLAFEVELEAAGAAVGAGAGAGAAAGAAAGVEVAAADFEEALAVLFAEPVSAAYQVSTPLCPRHAPCLVACDV